MRCIEIALRSFSFSLACRINRNMRCIEMFRANVKVEIVY